MYKYQWFCRWCSKLYEPVKRTPRDGFCSTSCKQAHYRAFKKYVTAKTSKELPAASQGVTPKKAKKGGDKRGKVKR